MSTLRVNQIQFNDAGNAYITQANSYNVTMFVNSTELMSFYSNNAIIVPNNVTFVVGGSNVGSTLNTTSSQANLAYNKANAALANATTTFAGDLTITGNTYLGTVNTSNVGIGLTAPTAKLHVRGSAVSEITTLTDGANIYPDLTSNTNFTVTLGGNRTFQNPNTALVGQSGVIYIQQDSTGSRTLSWGSYYRFTNNTAPTLSSSANSVDVVAYAVKNTTSIVCQTLLNVGG